MNAVLKPRIMLYRSTNTAHFDPANKEHRRKFKRFLNTGGWGEPCPFVVIQPYGSAASMCKDMLLRWYVERDRQI